MVKNALDLLFKRKVFRLSAPDSPDFHSSSTEGRPLLFNSL
ncbi:hypothetical protein N184_33980 [Sinorhizobium sp. GL28]|nr:hypothetical protein N184_33980 [Sinorhizobium sp. GL28]